MSKSFLDLVLSRFCMFYAYTRPRYQVSDYRTIGPLVSYFALKHRLLLLVPTVHVSANIRKMSRLFSRKFSFLQLKKL